MRTARLVLAAIFAASSAVAQATNYTSVEATAGKSVQLTYHATAHKNTCTPAPAPTVRVIEPPKNGLLIVRTALLTTDKIAGCPQLKTPAQVVFYQAKQNYSGPDHVNYEVTDANGQVGVYDVTIVVKPVPEPTVPKTGTSL
jgi:hypothetical protein